jgi:6-phosphofructokinase 1
MYFQDILDPKTKKMKIRMVDTDSESYYVANRYMIRLRHEDFDDPHELAKYAATANLSLEDFRKTFYYIVESERDNGPAKDGIILQEATTEVENLRKTKEK